VGPKEDGGEVTAQSQVSRSPAAPTSAVTSARDRQTLAARACRLLGVIFTASTAVTLVVPNLARPEGYLIELALLLAILGCYVQIGRSRSLLWPSAVYLLSIAALGATHLPAIGAGIGIDEFSMLALTTNIASLLVPTLVLGISDRPWFLAAVLPAYLPVLLLSISADLPSERVSFVVVTLCCYWIVFVLIAIWLASSSARASAGIARLARAHAAERRSSETEARRRYGARLQHDTVLATLTLIAHAGAGVDPDDLSERARTDAELLRRLRVDSTAPTAATGAPHPFVPPDPSASPDHSASPDPSTSPDPSALPEPLQAIDQRHAQSGLRVTWHGDRHLDQTTPAIEALIAAMSECLENVRRHSGVMQADVTLTHDESTIRVTVTDVGSGFDPHSIPAGRLGIAHSVQARIASVDGSVRIFSSPGRGTSVLMAVPR
jgi:signal transduction histidine kinase